MSTPRLHHFSPVFANARWASSTFGNSSVCYQRNPRSRKVERRTKGRRQWGRERDLYRLEVEHSLARDLENEVATIYKSLLAGETLSAAERTRWAQHLLSQFVRTPTFMRYENKAKELFGITDLPRHDRVGCPHCQDLRLVTTRDWLILVAHEDDSFVRTDNPVFLTGFLERPESVLCYPLSPTACFVACSMPTDWQPFGPSEFASPSYGVWGLAKGDAVMFDFYFARSAEHSLLVHPAATRDVLDKMFSDVLGLCPQPPFLLHHLEPDQATAAFESIRQIMNVTDGRLYPRFTAPELEPLYAPRR